MQTVKTIPGKTYAVESAGEVIITNTETGAIAAQGDGSGQVLFTACANSYDVSDDTAKVVALFKVAPRLKLTLLQGVAGGLLPKGFTELEYLESSGTQFIDTGIVTDGTYTIEGDMRVVSPRGSYWGRRTSAGGAESETFPDGNSLLTHIKPTSMPASVCINYIYRARPREVVDVTLRHRYAMKEGQKSISLDGVNVAMAAQNAYSVKAVNNNNLTYYLFCENKLTTATEMAVIAVYLFRMTDGVGNVVLDLVPILDADDTPCMYDRVSKLRFYNSGTGTFGYALKEQGTSRTYSLRNRSAVAPSGVYARKVGAGELELVADTEETTGEGWEWFANTGEAYENFGITQDELLTE